MAQGGRSRADVVLAGVFRRQTADEEGRRESDGRGQQDGQNGIARAVAGEKPVVNQAHTKQVNKAEDGSKDGLYDSVSFSKVSYLGGLFCRQRMGSVCSIREKTPIFNDKKREKFF